MTPMTITMPAISISLIMWVIGGVLALIVLFVRIAHHFATKKIDADLEKSLDYRNNALVKALESNEKSFVKALESHTSQAENRGLAICALLDNMSEKINDNKHLSNKIYDHIATGGDWSKKLDVINQNTVGVNNHKVTMRDILKYSHLIKDISNEIKINSIEIRQQVRENNGILRSNYGQRNDDVIKGSMI